MDERERRRFVRLPLNIEVDYLSESDAHMQPELYTTGSKNISAGGICLFVFEQLHKGELISLKLRLPLPDEHIIIAKGRVVWLNQLQSGTSHAKPVFEAGVEFVDLRESDRQLIEQCILRKL